LDELTTIFPDPTVTWDDLEYLNALGYNVDWKVLNAADYGDATSRERLFILARREHKPEFPAPTHSADGAGDTDEWRTAEDIIDWSEPGESIWTRSRPLVENTMRRIAEGIRRHGDPSLEPFADAVGSLGKADVAAMQERVVPAEYAPLVAQVLDGPFLVAPPSGAESSDAGPALASPHLVKYYGAATAKPVTEPVDTITAGGQKYGLCTPYLLGQHGGAMPRPVDGEPVPTVTARGYVRLFDAQPYVLPRNGAMGGLHSNSAYDPADRPLHVVTAKNHDGWLVSPALMRFSHGGALLDPDSPLPTITTAKGGVFAISQPHPYLVPYYSERQGQRPRVHSLDAPHPTVTATGSQTYLADPYLVQYHGQSGAATLRAPTPTVTTRDSLALVLPDLYPWGLDIRFRMLQPRELAAAQGFPPEYDFAGNKTETVEQIGNAVPVNLARSLVQSLLESETPALTDYLDDDDDDADAATVPPAAAATDGGEASAD
jgi:DNA (cytosine-5)-methyltransferase 1